MAAQSRTRRLQHREAKVTRAHSPQAFRKDRMTGCVTQRAPRRWFRARMMTWHCRSASRRGQLQAETASSSGDRDLSAPCLIARSRTPSINETGSIRRCRACRCADRRRAHAIRCPCRACDRFDQDFGDNDQAAGRNRDHVAAMPGISKGTARRTPSASACVNVRRGCSIPVIAARFSVASTRCLTRVSASKV